MPARGLTIEENRVQSQPKQKERAIEIRRNLRYVTPDMLSEVDGQEAPRVQMRVLGNLKNIVVDEGKAGSLRVKEVASRQDEQKADSGEPASLKKAGPCDAAVRMGVGGIAQSG